MRERKTTPSEGYHYTLAGLPHVRLSGITVYECAAGHGSVPVIPRIGELHRVIARTFIEKSAPLTGPELRFLRKNAGFSARKFAALLVIDPAHLSRVENGKQKALGPSTDRLARLVALAAMKGGDSVRDVLLREAAAHIERKKQRAAMFTLERNRWKAAA